MQNIIILGGGTAGWIVASGLSRALLKNGANNFNISLVESDEIGTIGVGEATIPSILDFIRFLNIDETDFVKNTDATYKLGIRFDNWLKQNHSYFHPFGNLGPQIDNKPLYAHWMRYKGMHDKGDLELMDLSISAKLAKKNRLLKPNNYNRISAENYGYALHFDASLVAQYLKQYSINAGVKRINAKVISIESHDNGDVKALVFNDETKINGDFFIDCSGFASMILGCKLGVKYQDWSQYLPCDSAIAIQSNENLSLNPFTISTAQEAGWTWQIPLRTRMGNGYVYSSQFSNDDKAFEILEKTIKGKAITAPRKIRFKAGSREIAWKNNVLALGLSSGFLEPLESTSIHLVIANLYRFLDFFPNGEISPILREKYNQKSHDELCEIRDFIILHYCTTKRDDSEFWNYCRNMEIPTSLKDKIEIFKSDGKIISDYYDLFKPSSWVSVLVGMGVEWNNFDNAINAIKNDFSKTILNKFTQAIENEANSSPEHKDVLEKVKYNAQYN